MDRNNQEEESQNKERKQSMSIWKQYYKKNITRFDNDNIIFKCIVKCGKVTTGGNPARDHLANERTILAYIRTSLTMVMYGLILLQLSKYAIVLPINEMVSNNNYGNLTEQQREIYNNTLQLLDCVKKFSKPLGALIFSLSLTTLVFGGIRYVRMWKMLFSDHDRFESGLPFSVVIVVGVVAVSVLAFVYAYEL